MRIAICDDEEAQQKLLEKYLTEWGSRRKERVEVCAFPNAESFLFQWEEDRQFELLILDIEMGALNGMELALKLREKGEEIPLLFISGYDRYMSQGYEVSALHYLLKPVHKEKLFSVLDKVSREKKPPKKLMFQMEEGILTAAVSDIWYIEAADHRCVLRTEGKSCELKHSFGELKKMLEEKEEIVCCHRSYLVNVQHVSAIMKTEIIMDDDTRIPVSRGAVKQVNEAFIRNYRG